MSFAPLAPTYVTLINKHNQQINDICPYSQEKKILHELLADFY